MSIDDMQFDCILGKALYIEACSVVRMNAGLSAV